MPTNRARMLGRPVPLLVLATALLIGAFSGVGYAATRKPAPLGTTTATVTSPKTSRATPKVVFHSLKLLNGAKSAAEYGTGTPQYAVSTEGVVYFAGSIEGPANPSLPAFIMPVNARPGYYDCFSVYSEGAGGAQVLGVLHVKANGRAYLGNSNFASLAGVSYVVGY